MVSTVSMPLEDSGTRTQARCGIITAPCLHMAPVFLEGAVMQID